MKPRIWFLVALVLVGCGSEDDAESGQGADGAIDAAVDAAVDAVVLEAGANEAGLLDAHEFDSEPDVAAEAGLDALSPYVCSIELAVTLQAATVQELREELVAGEEISVVDVREPNETASGIIDGAVQMPWTSGVLQSEHATLPSEQPTYVICGSGARSLSAGTYLVDRGHTCVFNVQGGMNAWKAAGYPTVLP